MINPSGFFLNPFTWIFIVLPIAVISQHEGLAVRSVSGTAGPGCRVPFRNATSPIIPNIQAELGPQLAGNASIVLANDAAWASEIERWSIYARPTFSAVVEVTNEKDVQATVRWANKYSIPFIAMGGHHGSNTALGNFNGISISFVKMKGVQIADDGQSANLGVGLKSGEAMRALFAAGKRTTTGSCLCTGIIGPLLGGGHGMLQGQHGLMADNLLEARVVLANGNAVTVSNTENPDLFWAIRGAGHNFGILTAVKMRIYDQPKRDWSYLSIIYPGAMVEKIFAASNEFNKNVPAEMTNFIVMRQIPQINPNATIVMSNFFYDGSLADLTAAAAPFLAVPQMFNRTGTGPYPVIYNIGMSNETSPQCYANSYKNILGVELNTYAPATERTVYDTFNKAVLANPGLANGNVIFEAYGRTKVLEVADDAMAVDYRGKAVSISPQMIYMDPNLTPTAVSTGKQIRDTLQSQTNSELSTYVNYSFGDESLEAMYGASKLDRLLQLKKRYDPENKFRYYAPLVSSS